MKTFRNMVYVLFGLLILSLAAVLVLAVEEVGGMALALLNVSVAVVSVALVGVITAIMLYFNSKNFTIVVLKRRASKVYGELLLHKMKLIDIMDDEKPLSDWESFLYNDDEFSRIKKFLYEEYFLLLHYEPFLTKSAATAAVDIFCGMHKELENFMRSVMYDRIEYNKFRRRFAKVQGQDIGPETPEAAFTVPELEEAYDALYSANEYALFNVDHLLKDLDAQLAALDIHFSAGVPWSTTKPNYDAEFQLWMGSRD